MRLNDRREEETTSYTDCRMKRGREGGRAGGREGGKKEGRLQERSKGGKKR